MNFEGDPLYADVRFFAEGRVVRAHRFLLEQRSSYFRALFRSGMTGGGGGGGQRKGGYTGAVTSSQRVIEIAVPGTGTLLY